MYRFKKNGSIAEYSLPILTTLLATLLIWRGMYGFFADSELWSVTLAKNFPSEWKHSWVFTRIAFYLPLALFEAPFANTSHVLSAARIAMLINALGITALSGLIAARLSNSSKAGWIAAILVLCHPTFFNHSYRVRADLIATTLVLLPFWHSLRSPASRFNHWLTLLLPLLATVKSALIAAPFLLLHASRISKRGRRTIIVSMAIATIAGATAVVTVYSDTLAYVFAAFEGSDSTPAYFSISRFYYLLIALAHGAPLFLLVLIRSATLWARLHNGAFGHCDERSNHLLFARVLILMSILIALNPEKLPYFIASIIPFYAIYAAGLLSDIAALQRAPKAWTDWLPKQRNLLERALAVFLLVPLGMVITDFSEKRITNSNANQLKAIRILSETLKNNGNPEFFDGIGLVPTRMPMWGMVGPNQAEANERAMQALKNTVPEFIFYGTRLYFVGPGLATLLAERYIHLGMGVYGKACPTGSPMQCPSLNPNRFTIEISGEDWIFLQETSLQEYQELISKVVVDHGGTGAKSVKFSPYILPPEKLDHNLIHLFRFDGEA